MFNKLKEQIGGYFAQKRLKEMKETISLLQIEKEDTVWQNLIHMGEQTDFNITDLQLIRQTAFTYYHKNSMIKQGIRLTTEFVFAAGVSMPKSNNAKVQEAIKEIWNNEQNQAEMFSYQAQKEKSDDLLINGEIFLVLFESESTKDIEIASIEAGEIKEVITSKDNKKKVLFYKRVYFEKEFNFNTGQYEIGKQKTIYYKDWRNENEELPEGLSENSIGKGVIKHIKINGVRGKRGISEAFIALGWARAHKSMCEDLATWSKAKSIFAWKKKLKKGAKAQIAAIKATYDQKEDLSNPSPATASTIIENQGIDNTPMDYKSGASDWEKDIRQMVLPIAAGFGYSEQYFGNPSTANLAIGEKLELPLLKKIEGWQKFWEDQYLDIIKYSLKIRGYIDSIADYEIDDEQFDVDIDFPPIIIFDIKKYMEALEIAKRIGGIDQQELTFRTLVTLGVNNVSAVTERMKKELEKNPVVPIVPVIPKTQTQFESNVMDMVYELSKAIKENEDVKV